MDSPVLAREDQASAMKFGAASIVSKSENLSISSPVKWKTDTIKVVDLRMVADDVALKSRGSLSSSRGTASKDEYFFESQPWLESDCEDDYYSVKGDFTPSLRSTPVHHQFSLEIPQVNKSPYAGGTNIPASELFSLEKKTSLLDLFKESTRNEQQEPASENKTNSTNWTRYVSRVNSGREEGESLKSTQQSCFPRFLPTCSYSDRRKRIRAGKNKNSV